MKLELNVVRFENEDVIATSCQGLEHLYVTDTPCPTHGQGTFLEWESWDGESYWTCYSVGNYYTDQNGDDISSGVWHWVPIDEENGYYEPCSVFEAPSVPTTAAGVDYHNNH